MQFEQTFLWLSLVIASGSMPTVGSAQSSPDPSPYAGIENRAIKALSAQQIEGYEAGSGMGLALAAELNGYPGPKHVLELQDALDLSPEQLRQVERVYDEMKVAAVSLGNEIIECEAELDRLFATHAVDAESLVLQTREIGTLEARLRAVHLGAHLEMMDILQHEQIRSYIELRGYQGPGPGNHSSGDHTHIHH